MRPEEIKAKGKNSFKSGPPVLLVHGI
jgi:hypothetical protein